MPEYRRYHVPGASYFFAVVTHQRRPILTTELGRNCLRRAFQTVRAKRSFDLPAIVLLPDHIHAIWTLPRLDADYSPRWTQIKERFTRFYLDGGGDEGLMSASREHHRERAIWQRRFWEHTCADEDDLARCMDYIHWNPMKHGLVEKVRDYPWSSFHRYMRRGAYDPEWGGTNPCPELRFEGGE